MTSATRPNKQTWIGIVAVLASLMSQNIGAAFAKHLFPLVGAAGMTTLRIGMAACLLVLIRRAWRRPPVSGHFFNVLCYGAVLGLMNLLIYQAFARIPIGIAVAIEVLGPLAVVLFSARRPADFASFLVALLGLWLLLPLHAVSAPLDPVGIACAVAPQPHGRPTSSLANDFPAPPAWMQWHGAWWWRQC
ncbi:MAG: EamA family transporter [Janthinobacterium lividum]